MLLPARQEHSIAHDALREMRGALGAGSKNVLKDQLSCMYWAKLIPGNEAERTFLGTRCHCFVEQATNKTARGNVALHLHPRKCAGSGFKHFRWKIALQQRPSCTSISQPYRNASVTEHLHRGVLWNREWIFQKDEIVFKIERIINSQRNQKKSLKNK